MVLVTPVEGTEVMVSPFHLQNYKTKAGFSCWLILENMSREIIESYLRLHGESIRGLLFRLSLSDWVSSVSSPYIAQWFEEWSQVYRTRGYYVGVLCEVDWNQVMTDSPRWFYYQTLLDVVILKVNKSSASYSCLLLYVIGLLVRMGIASNKLVVPFSLPSPTTLDVYNLKGWVVTYQDVMKHGCWQYLPAYGMMF